MLTWIVIGLFVLLLVYIRLAPSDPQRWHRQAAVKGVETRQLKGGYVWRKEIAGDGAGQMEAMEKVILATPRTQKLAGSIEEGQVTYVTRSLAFGFPDYTTVSVIDAGANKHLEVYGRLRFGRSDFGVNAKRIKGWIAAAQL
ncbi:DUF1499 domain-containing protein [Sulfitobacter sediminis]